MESPSQSQFAFIENVNDRMLIPKDYVNGRYIFVYEPKRRITGTWRSYYVHVFDMFIEKQYSFRLWNCSIYDRHLVCLEVINSKCVLLCVTTTTGHHFEFLTLNYAHEKAESTSIDFYSTNHTASSQMIFDRDQSKLFIREVESIRVFDVNTQNFTVESICDFHLTDWRAFNEVHWYDDKIWFFTRTNEIIENTISCFDVKKKNIDVVKLAIPKEMQIEGRKKHWYHERWWKNEFCYTQFTYTDCHCHEHRQPPTFSILNLHTMEIKIWKLDVHIPANIFYQTYSESGENQLVCEQRKYQVGEQKKIDYTFYRIPTRVPDRLYLLALFKARPQLKAEVTEAFANRIPL
ncbi:hypothetical protein M3Y95_00825700 [Aphelenchoides besseyi]|nr:hypothetical protein M3Y95_00825700 [Aphelenchoides besseyi]